MAADGPETCVPVWRCFWICTILGIIRGDLKIIQKNVMSFGVEMWFVMNFAALSGHKMAAGGENLTVIFFLPFAANSEEKLYILGFFQRRDIPLFENSNQ